MSKHITEKRLQEAKKSVKFKQESLRAINAIRRPRNMMGVLHRRHK